MLLQFFSKRTGPMAVGQKTQQRRTGAFFEVMPDAVV